MCTLDVCQYHKDIIIILAKIPWSELSSIKHNVTLISSINKPTVAIWGLEKLKQYTDNEYSSHCLLIFQPIGYVVLAKTSVEEQYKIMEKCMDCLQCEHQAMNALAAVEYY